MRTIEVKVVTRNGTDDETLIENVFDMYSEVYNLLFVERWCEFLYGFETMEIDGFSPEIESGVTNSPHDYDAEDFYMEEFTSCELDYIADNYMPEGDEDFGCGSVVKVSVLDNGEERVLYE